jgi:hypothetical protein
VVVVNVKSRVGRAVFISIDLSQAGGFDIRAPCALVRVEYRVIAVTAALGSRSDKRQGCPPRPALTLGGHFARIWRGVSIPIGCSFEPIG